MSGTLTLRLMRRSSVTEYLRVVSCARGILTGCWLWSLALTTMTFAYATGAWRAVGWAEVAEARSATALVMMAVKCMMEKIVCV